MADKEKWAGGPNTGGHQAAGGWTEQYGNDYGCGVGEPVYAAFDCKVLPVGWYPGLLDGVSADGKKYGLQMIVANDDPSDPDRVQAYYTHLNQIDKNVKPFNSLKRGAPIGRVRSAPGVGVHLHFAMRERVGSTWDKYKGVDIPKSLAAWAASTSEVHTIRFSGDGKPPVTDPQPAAPPPRFAPPISSEIEGYRPGYERHGSDESAPYGNPAYSCLPGGGAGVDQIAEAEPVSEGLVALSRMPAGRVSPASLLRLQRAIGNRGTVAALRSPRPVLLLPLSASAPETLRPAPADAESTERLRDGR